MLAVTDRRAGGYRAGFAYIDGLMPNGDVQPLCRLRFGGVLHTWGFAIYLASHDGYQDSVLPVGRVALGD
jgi:hypothetical protein